MSRSRYAAQQASQAYDGAQEGYEGYEGYEEYQGYEGYYDPSTYYQNYNPYAAQQYGGYGGYGAAINHRRKAPTGTGLKKDSSTDSATTEAPAAPTPVPKRVSKAIAIVNPTTREAVVVPKPAVEETPAAPEVTPAAAPSTPPRRTSPSEDEKKAETKSAKSAATKSSAELTAQALAHNSSERETDEVLSDKDDAQKSSTSTSESTVGCDSPQDGSAPVDGTPGRRKYDSSFLLSCRFTPSQCPPEIKTFAEIFLEAGAPPSSPSRPVGRRESNHGFSTSSPSRGGANNRRRPPTIPFPTQGPDRGAFGTSTSKIPTPQSTPLSFDALPNRADERFRATVATDEVRVLQKKVNGLLNKLSPEKYESIRTQLIELNLDMANDTVVEILIGSLYERAVSQPVYVKLYADICEDFRNVAARAEDNSYAPSPDSPAPTSPLGPESEGRRFRRHLLNKCQKEFETPTTLPPEASAWTEEERQEKSVRLRKRTVGLITFVSEVFKRDILTEKIMHAVIRRLLTGQPPAATTPVDLPSPTGEENPNAEDLEILCKLLTTCGAKLDRPAARSLMDTYFGRLAHHKLHFPEPRIRFIIQDVMDLRSSRWVARKLAQ